MNIYELAKKYYPDKWNDAMLRKLTEAGKLTEEQYEEITGKAFK